MYKAIELEKEIKVKQKMMVGLQDRMAATKEKLEAISPLDQNPESLSLEPHHGARSQGMRAVRTRIRTRI